MIGKSIWAVNYWHHNCRTAKKFTQRRTNYAADSGSLENTVGGRFYARQATKGMAECEPEMVPVVLVKILTKRCNNFDAARDMCRL